jgi:hypothetical protein
VEGRRPESGFTASAGGTEQLSYMSCREPNMSETGSETVTDIVQSGDGLRTIRGKILPQWNGKINRFT